KWTDRHSAQVGEVVTFYLKYTNVGGKPITNVVLSDSLTGRLEFVPGTARSDRPNTFTTQANEAGSVILRWEIGGKLLPGESGMVSFQAVVRAAAPQIPEASRNSGVCHPGPPPPPRWPRRHT